ncbi:MULTISPECIES: PDR/VanB family oxidoreductase [Delftia]|uniref:Oxidoreductase n=1 Tax=Delftia lacustris TaxID=558537 RepID=A0A7T3DH93_9BURK|nr:MULTISPECIES: PDR/VanB family oxidoreductase [Delftia]QPS78221.1 oxidoreductase [Delftia acidovorans]QPS78226.1 oxidoreductase [Delftia acidovorans]QPS84787.1 oxidoreductase [Delftia lacustris]
MNSFTNGLQVRVAAKTLEAIDICSFELVAVDGQGLPAFSAGSHVDVQVSEGVTRQYSLCNDPAESHRYVIAVLKDPNTRGGSKAMHERVQPGDVLTISPPKNHFPLAHGASRSLLLAGGIGVTPILCMAERLSVLGGKFEMHYATRSRDRTAFAARIQQAPYASRVQFHFDDGAPEQKLDVGRVLTGAGAGTHLYVCGPKGFMDHVLSTAHAQGWPEAEMHYEFFGAVVAKTDEDQSFRVKLASSGRIILVPKEKTVVQALVAAGVEVPTSCEQGVCGTCLTRVLEGEPDHKDFYLTPAEQAANDQFMPCCSRSKSPMLVLDL